jgi:ureidoglycolate lyase
MHRIPVVPLTKASFAPFGDVIETEGAVPIEINQGFARRVNDLASIDVMSVQGTINISLFAAKARPVPIAIKLMERHPLGSQLFFPLQDRPWLVLVCDDPHTRESFRGFRASGQQGVNYARNIWHHPLLVLGDGERFLVVDRGGTNNLEEVWLDEELILDTARS